jgi:hypothetical protein
MSAIPVTPITPARRHALGLPAGSVRALHTLIIVGVICALVWLTPRDGRPVPIPPYLLYLLFLALGHFFAAHGNSIAPAGSDSASPLHLPAGFVRLLIVVLLLGTLGYKLATDQQALSDQVVASVDGLKNEPLLPAIMLAGFFLGVIFRWITHGDRSYWAQDFQAWVSLIAMVLLAVAALIHLVIQTSLPEELHMSDWEGFVGAVVAFYFGERS